MADLKIPTIPQAKDPCEQNREKQSQDMVASALNKTFKKLMNMRKKMAPFEHVTLVPHPSFRSAKEIVVLGQQILFPGFFSQEQITEVNVQYYTGQLLSRFYDLLSKEVAAAIRHDCYRFGAKCTNCAEQGRDIALEVVEALPGIKETLASDVRAAKEGDPAAGEHLDQIIFCYPGLFATMVHRLAHELYTRNVPFVPRILSEYAHSKTGIDIHPGANIDESFFIDHGTGVVIGETTKIGKHVRIYQGVTLGALSLPKDAGARLSGKKRHPTLEDEVIVYAGATILGGETVIGTRSVVGGNVWLTESVPPDTKVLIKKPELVIVNGR